MLPHACGVRLRVGGNAVWASATKMKALYGNGHLLEAEKIYRQVLKLSPITGIVSLCSVSSTINADATRRRSVKMMRSAIDVLKNRREPRRAVQAALRKKNRPRLRKIATALGVGVATVQRVSRRLGMKAATDVAAASVERRSR